MAELRMRINAGHLRQQTHAQNMEYLLHLHCKNDNTIETRCYVIRTLLLTTSLPPKST